MTTIVVQRYAGDRDGGVITDGLLSTDEAKVARGRSEMDANAQPMQEHNMEVVHRPGIRPGQLAEVQDQDQGETYRAKVTSVRYHFVGGDDPSISIEVGLIRPRSDML